MKPSAHPFIRTLFFIMLIAVPGIMLSATATAELSPQVYADMQNASPEFLQIRVEQVDTGWCFLICRSRNITVTATVTAVTRTATQLTVGDTITIHYKHQRPIPGFVGPSPIPILEAGQTYPAYLEVDDENPAIYTPRARGQSFYTFASHSFAE